MRPLRIEEVALNAWPALQQMLYDGWLLRFSNGYTKRANSVTVLYPGALDLIEKIERCESDYTRRDLAAIFRLTSFNPPPELDPLLEKRGYEKLSPTLVLGVELAHRHSPRIPTVTSHSAPLDSWLAEFCRLRGAPLAQHETHRQMLAAIPGQVMFSTLRDESGAVAGCGIAIMEGVYVGLFDLITDPARRGQGYGSAMVASLLAWAESVGARYAYLQVEESNAPARRVYEAKFGYETRYWYWYRIRASAK